MKITNNNGKINSTGISEVGQVFMAVTNFNLHQFNLHLTYLEQVLSSRFFQHPVRVFFLGITFAIVEYSICSLKPYVLCRYAGQLCPRNLR